VKRKPPEPVQLELDFSARPPADDLAHSKVALRETLLRSYMEGLADPSWRVRKKAARQLGELSSDALEAVPLLEGMLRDNELRVREAAASALERIRS